MHALCARNDVDHSILRDRTHKNRSPQPESETRTFCVQGRRANHSPTEVVPIIVRSNCAYNIIGGPLDS